MRAVLADERGQVQRSSRLGGDGRVTDPLYGMMHYHLGWVDAEFRPAVVDGGKKLRGQLCLLAAALFDGDGRVALPLAAAVELLHNFTLVHDDIQDRSALRRHRETVWHRWGIAQAINVGDGLYALARLALRRLADRGVAPELVLELAAEGERTLLHIMEGQYLDLQFEQDWLATEELYRRMIEAKTARLIAYSCAAGGRLGGATPAEAALLGEVGLAIGLGFQVRDDILGIWGAPEVTGKPPAADIRSRKKSLPVLIAMERATAAEVAAIQAAYRQSEVVAGDIDRVLAVLERTGSAADSQRWVETYSQTALSGLSRLGRQNEASATLRRLAEQLVERQY